MAAKAQATAETETPVIIRIPEVCRVTGMGRSTIYELVARGNFPAPLILARGSDGRARVSGWVQSEVIGWIEQRMAERATRATA